MNDLILVAKAFADPTRLRIMAALCQSELCVCELCDALEITQSTLSNHLQTIRQAGLVATRKDGTWVYYSVEPTQAALVHALFAHYQAALKADARLQRDTARLKQRLQIREGERCTRGFAQLNG
jgi:ArsR family transcriptional regulator